MAQYTFSFLRSEYDRIPFQLKNRLTGILAESKADPEIKALIEEVCAEMVRAVEDICKYTQDQLQIK